MGKTDLLLPEGARSLQSAIHYTTAALLYDYSLLFSLASIISLNDSENFKLFNSGLGSSV